MEGPNCTESGTGPRVIVSSSGVTGHDRWHLAHRHWRRIASAAVIVGSKSTRATAAQNVHAPGMRTFSGPGAMLAVMTGGTSRTLRLRKPPRRTDRRSSRSPLKLADHARGEGNSVWAGEDSRTW